MLLFLMYMAMQASEGDKFFWHILFVLSDVELSAILWISHHFKWDQLCIFFTRVVLGCTPLSLFRYIWRVLHFRNRIIFKNEWIKLTMIWILEPAFNLHPFNIKTSANMSDFLWISYIIKLLFQPNGLARVALCQLLHLRVRKLILTWKSECNINLLLASWIQQWRP